MGIMDHQMENLCLDRMSMYNEFFNFIGAWTLCELQLLLWWEKYESTDGFEKKLFTVIWYLALVGFTTFIQLSLLKTQLKELFQYWLMENDSENFETPREESATFLLNKRIEVNYTGWIGWRWHWQYLEFFLITLVPDLALACITKKITTDYSGEAVTWVVWTYLRSFAVLSKFHLKTDPDASELIQNAILEHRPYYHLASRC